MGSKLHKIFFSVFFLILIYLPSCLKAVSDAMILPYETNVAGYSQITEKPPFSLIAWIEGLFQAEYAKWFEQALRPRGTLIKTYATIRFNLFNLGNRPIGYNRDVFEWQYIDEELGINGRGFSTDAQYEEMRGYVEKLSRINEMLAEKEKTLFIYIAPNKADFHEDNLLESWKGLKEPGSIEPIECFRELLDTYQIPYLICRDLRDDLDYPAFYNTGIHWSRTYEQKVSALIVEELSRLCKKRYRKIVLGDVTQSDTPFWRDADVYSLLNVYNALPNERYYQYAALRQAEVESYDKMRFLIQGDSFAEGIVYDVNTLYPNDDLFLMTRDWTINDVYGTTERIDGNFNNIDLSYYLNQVDAVLLEATEANMRSYSFGFVDYLLEYLANYEPSEPIVPHAEVFFAGNKRLWNDSAMRGIRASESGFAWGGDNCQFILKTEKVKKRGIEVVYSVPEYLFQNEGDTVSVEVFLNGEKACSNVYREPWIGSVYVHNDDVPEEDLCFVEIYCDKSFIPIEIGLNNDTQKHSLQFFYVGEKR